MNRDPEAPALQANMLRLIHKCDQGLHLGSRFRGLKFCVTHHQDKYHHNMYMSIFSFQMLLYGAMSTPKQYMLASLMQEGSLGRQKAQTYIICRLLQECAANHSLVQ